MENSALTRTVVPCWRKALLTTTCLSVSEQLKKKNMNRDTFSHRAVGSSYLPSRLNMVKCWTNLTSAYFGLRVPRVCGVQVSTRTVIVNERRRNSRLGCPATEFSGSQLVWRPRNSVVGRDKVFFSNPKTGSVVERGGGGPAWDVWHPRCEPVRSPPADEFEEWVEWHCTSFAPIRLYGVVVK